VSDCCRVGDLKAPDRCPGCGEVGRKLGRITLKALLRPEALAGLSAPEHRFCATASCRVVYFGLGEVFRREDVAMPVFRKEPAGRRTVCYCFAVSEDDIRREIEATSRATVVERITGLVKSDRCACEVRNPQGTCCLGNVTRVVKAALAQVAATTA
jgi:hypothetical protein